MSSGIENIESNLLLYFSKSSALAIWPSSIRSPKKAITCGWENFNALEKVFSKYLCNKLQSVRLSLHLLITIKLLDVLLIIPITIPSCYPWTKVILIFFPEYLRICDKKNLDALGTFAHGPLELLYFIYEKFIVKYCHKNYDTNWYYSVLQPV